MNAVTHISRHSWDSALHIPRRRFDPVAAAVWLVLIPVSAVVGWYGVWRVLHALWKLVSSL
jgi:hypothetical protein